MTNTNDSTTYDMLKVVILTDVSMGYGTPQLLRLAESLCKRYGARVSVFEPHQHERPAINVGERLPGCDVTMERIYTSGHTFTLEGRIEFVEATATKLNLIKPDILIMSGLHRLPVIEKIEGFSPLKIFYCLEEIEERWTYIFPLASECDLVIFPEENRKRIYTNKLRIDISKTELLVMYNSNNYLSGLETKNKRILYAGSFHRQITLAKYFENKRIYSQPIDIYGLIDGFKDKNELLKMLKGGSGSQYLGYMETNENYFKTISKYLYSIVIWNPDTEDRFFAAPNKLFDALACGVPPIAAPHPQCREIIERFECGILLDDWSLEALHEGIKFGLEEAKTENYVRMVQNCLTAMETELSWDKQFEKLSSFIDVALSTSQL